MHERHGKSRSKLYNTWRGMKERCLNPQHTSYPNYGGRGIKLVKAWESFAEFEKWAQKSGYQEGMSIERIDTNYHYEPQNCTWSTPKGQGQNRRDSCHVTINYETYSVAVWAEKTGIAISTLYKRYDRGIRGEAFIAPPKTRKPTLESTP